MTNVVSVSATRVEKSLSVRSSTSCSPANEAATNTAKKMTNCLAYILSGCFFLFVNKATGGDSPFLGEYIFDLSFFFLGRTPTNRTEDRTTKDHQV